MVILIPVCVINDLDLLRNCVYTMDRWVDADDDIQLRHKSVNHPSDWKKTGDEGHFVKAGQGMLLHAVSPPHLAQARSGEPPTDLLLLGAQSTRSLLLPPLES